MKVEDLIKSNWIAPFQWLPAEDRGPRFLEWLEDVESKFATVEWPKVEEGGKKLKRNTLFAVAGPEIRDKLKTLTGTGENYYTAVQKLKEDLLADEPLIFLISQALDMTQRERERIDDCALRVRKAHRRIDWDTVKEKHDLTNLMPILSVARGRDYCLSHKGIPELEAILLKGRSKESTIYKNREMTGNLDTAGREVAVKLEKTDIETAYAVKNRYGKYSKRYELDQTQRSTILARIKVRLKLGVRHPSCATSVAILGHILGGKQNVLHTKKNVETVDVKTILQDAAKVQLKRDLKVV